MSFSADQVYIGSSGMSAPAGVLNVDSSITVPLGSTVSIGVNPLATVLDLNGVKNTITCGVSTGCPALLVSLDTLQEMSDRLTSDAATIATLTSRIITLEQGFAPKTNPSFSGDRIAFSGGVSGFISFTSSDGKNCFGIYLRSLGSTTLISTVTVKSSVASTDPTSGDVVSGTGWTKRALYFSN
jgi:hypothetical protein